MSNRIEISVNGEKRLVPVASDALELVAALQLTGKRIAIEINGEILPRSLFAEHRFSDGDQIEIIHAVGGG